MKNKQNLILFYGCFCSILFALFYYVLFAFVYDEAIKVSYLQVGVYEKVESLKKCQSRLENLKIDNYTIKKEKENIVICGMEEYEKVKEKLEKEKINYLEKKMMLQNDEQVELWEQKKYDKVLEMVLNESKTNE